MLWRLVLMLFFFSFLYNFWHIWSEFGAFIFFVSSNQTQNTQCNMNDYIGSHPQAIQGNPIAGVHTVQCSERNVCQNIKNTCDSCQVRPASPVFWREVVGKLIRFIFGMLGRKEDSENIRIDYYWWIQLAWSWTILVHCLLSRRYLCLQHISSTINTI